MKSIRVLFHSFYLIFLIFLFLIWWRICFNNEIREIEDDGFKGLDSLKYLWVYAKAIMILPSFLRNSMLDLNSELSIDIPKRNVILTILPSQERIFSYGHFYNSGNFAIKQQKKGSINGQSSVNFVFLLCFRSLMDNNLSQVPVSLKDVKNISHL